MDTKRCKVLVIGAGPGGYVAAIRSGQLGMDTIIVEGEKAGGTCLIRGCIPSKAIIHAAHKFHSLSKHNTKEGHMGITIPSPAELNLANLISWKEEIVNKLNKGVEGLLKAAKVKLVSGWAKFIDAKTCIVTNSEGEVRIEAEHVILANGSIPIELPFMPFDENVISSRDALELNELPKHLVVVGGGYIGLELGIAYRLLGAEVTIIEAMDSVLPIFDKELRRPVELYLKKNKITVHTKSLAKGVEKTTNGIKINYTDPKGVQKSLDADKILVTVGRKPRSKDAGIEKMGVKMNEQGFVIIDNKCSTNMRNVWAIGDVADSGEMLAHVASTQGEMVAEIIAGNIREYDPISVPAIVFTEPEIVSVGMSPDEANKYCSELETKLLTGKFPLAANGRALTMEAEKSGGFVRVLAREDNHQILGIQAVGSSISELSGEFSLALEMGALLEDVAGTIHAHPTMTESFHEAILATLGHAIHIS